MIRIWGRGRGTGRKSKGVESMRTWRRKRKKRRRRREESRQSLLANETRDIAMMAESNIFQNEFKKGQNQCDAMFHASCAGGVDETGARKRQ